MIKIVRGEPSPEELAAIVTVIAARASAGTPAEPPAPSQWNSPARLVRTPLLPGPGAWRASGWAR